MVLEPSPEDVQCALVHLCVGVRVRQKNKPVVRPCDRPKCFLARLKTVLFKTTKSTFLCQNQFYVLQFMYLCITIAILEVLPKFLLFQSVKCVTSAIMEVLPKFLPFHNNKKHNLKT